MYINILTVAFLHSIHFLESSYEARLVAGLAVKHDSECEGNPKTVADSKVNKKFFCGRLITGTSRLHAQNVLVNKDTKPPKSS